MPSTISLKRCPRWAEIRSLPVFGKAQPSGWAGPSVFGWLCFAVFWANVWWILVQAITRHRK
jgi:hypothetical protein